MNILALSSCLSAMTLWWAIVGTVTVLWGGTHWVTAQRPFPLALLRYSVQVSLLALRISLSTPGCWDLRLVLAAPALHESDRSAKRFSLARISLFHQRLDLAQMVTVLVSWSRASGAS